MVNTTHNIDIQKIDISIQLLNKYMKEVDIKPLISVLEALKQDQNNEALLVQLTETVNSLGVYQGAVITYAPYVGILLSHDLFGDN